MPLASYKTHYETKPRTTYNNSPVMFRVYIIMGVQLKYYHAPKQNAIQYKSIFFPSSDFKTSDPERLR